MAHSEKQNLQKARAWFKFVLTGLTKPANMNYLSDTEKDFWHFILETRKYLLEIHDETSRELGLNVPKYKCGICGKGEQEEYVVTKDGETYNLCKKHFKEEMKNGE